MKYNIPPELYFILDREKLVEETLQSEKLDRQPQWSESVAVGSQGFIEGIKNQRNRGASGRKSLECDDSFILRESSAPYNCYLPTQKGLLNSENSCFLIINDLKSGD